MKEADQGPKRSNRRPARIWLSVAEQAKMSLEELAQGILDRRLRPGVVQQRRLAEAVLAKQEWPGSAAKKATTSPAKDVASKAKKTKKDEKKKGKKPKGRKLPKIPKAPG